MPSTIKTQNFSSYTTEYHRENWTGAVMSCVVDALKGETVLIELDNSTGFTVEGRLTGITNGIWGSNWTYVVVASDSNPNGVAYPLNKVGVIVTLSNSNAKWDAQANYRKLESAAIKAGRAKIGEGREWGKWSAAPGKYAGSFHVTYEPNTGNAHYADKCGTRGWCPVVVNHLLVLA